MKAELVCKSTECEINILQHSPEKNELTQRFIAKVFVPMRTSRVEFRNGRYCYSPSKRWEKFAFLNRNK
jgi:hypothetical protein